MKFPNGTSVRVHAPGFSTHRRTGVVVDDSPKFPWRDHRRVRFDELPGRIKGELVPEAELRVIKPSERPASAPPREQIDLFGGTA